MILLLGHENRTTDSLGAPPILYLALVLLLNFNEKTVFFKKIIYQQMQSVIISFGIQLIFD